MFNSRPYGYKIPNRKDWFRISAKESREGEVIGNIEIFDFIDPHFGINASELTAQVRAMNVDRIHVSINSPGGDVFSGISLYGALKSHKAKISTENLGLSASIASVILMAGDEIFLHPQSMVMIHRAWAGAIGSASELRETASILDKIDGQLISIYSEKTKVDPIIIEGMMEKETWLTAPEAVEMNFGAILEYETIKAKAAFDLSIYKNTPDLLKKITNEDLLAKARSEEDAKRSALQKDFLKRRIELAEYI